MLGWFVGGNVGSFYLLLPLMSLVRSTWVPLLPRQPLGFPEESPEAGCD